MRLYFMRHGIAEDYSPDKTDEQRQLTLKGIEKTHEAVPFFGAIGVQPALIYTSPLSRAEQTAEILAKGLESRIMISPLLAPGALQGNIEHFISQHPNEDIMLVGHEPDLSETIKYLIGGGRLVMKKGTLARVDITSGSMASGELIWLLPPRTQEDW
jgi:phosphohistidine phosphatase